MEIFTTMITPYCADGSVDYETALRYVDWYYENGLTGIFAVCQSSEIFYLTLEERVELNRRVYARAKELGMEQICAFAILQTAELFVMEDSDVLWQAEYILRDNKVFLHQVISPQEHKIYQYQTEDISERFFMEDRASDLKEVSFDETT